MLFFFQQILFKPYYSFIPVRYGCLEFLVSDKKGDDLISIQKGVKERGEKKKDTAKEEWKRKETKETEIDQSKRNSL